METFINELSELILNGVSPAQYVASFLFATLGGIASLLYGTKKRKTDNGENPEKFSKTYLVLNNAQRIFGSIVATFFLIRLSNTAFDPNITIGLSVLFGYSSDVAMNFLRKIESKASSDYEGSNSEKQG